MLHPQDSAIVAAISELARALDLAVVAEGVETAAQVELIQRFNCTEAQGFFFDRPMPADAFERLVEAQIARRAKAEAITP